MYCAYGDTCLYKYLSKQTNNVIFCTFQFYCGERICAVCKTQPQNYIKTKKDLQFRYMHIHLHNLILLVSFDFLQYTEHIIFAVPRYIST
jgi:hypothetical protein